MKTKNLFGDLVAYPEKPKKKTHMSPYQIFKMRNSYRPKDDNNRRCKNCEHHIIVHFHDKTYHKCEILGISSSSATDIRVNHVCDKWVLEIQEGSS